MLAGVKSGGGREGACLMTDEDRDLWRLEMRERMAELREQMATMQQQVGDIKKVNDSLDAYLLQPRSPGKPSRASELDDVLAAVRAGGFGLNVLKGLAAIIAAVGVVWAALQWGKGP